MPSDREQNTKLVEFDLALAMTGLNLTEAELERMREGYAGLQLMISRMPRDLAMEAEPAIIATPPGARSTR
ncbi:MAG: hypothetical protein CBC34_014565 [Hyphomicrobiaceae bacterium TMED74]|nr:hypothetical protein [Filomicrobium sp.]RPG39264.1 MAG: hypothetical protein CBC34_014565 [Hyphomicrobiaceae bacterium TMED74]